MANFSVSKDSGVWQDAKTTDGENFRLKFKVYPYDEDKKNSQASVSRMKIVDSRGIVEKKISLCNDRTELDRLQNELNEVTDKLANLMTATIDQALDRLLDWDGVSVNGVSEKFSRDKAEMLVVVPRFRDAFTEAYDKFIGGVETHRSGNLQKQPEDGRK